MQKALTLSLVIPVHNEEYYLKDCLDAIVGQSRLPDEILVVDNNSTDRTVALALQFPLVRIVAETTQGVLYASRTGFNEAKSDIICRIDADTIMEPNWIEEVQEFFVENPTIAAVTGNCYFYDFPFRHVFRLVHHAVYYSTQKLIAGTEILWGSNMAIKNSAWRAVRGQCVNRSDIHEDIDLSLRLQARRLAVRRSDKLVVGVSLWRGDINPGKIINYLWPWPNTYWANKRYLQATLVGALLLVVWAIILPLSGILWLFSSCKRLLNKRV